MPCPPPSACILGDGGGVGGFGLADELDDGMALGAGDCGRDVAAGGLGTALALAPTLSLLGLRSILGFSGALSDSGRSYFTPPGAKTFAVFFEDPTSRAASLGLEPEPRSAFS